MMSNDLYLIRKWSRHTEIFNKFTYGVLPEHMNTLSILFTIDTYIIHGLNLEHIC
jgi:hypothetical protein